MPENGRVRITSYTVELKVYSKTAQRRLVYRICIEVQTLRESVRNICES